MPVQISMGTTALDEFCTILHNLVSGFWDWLGKVCPSTVLHKLMQVLLVYEWLLLLKLKVISSSH